MALEKIETGSIYRSTLTYIKDRIVPVPDFCVAAALLLLLGTAVLADDRIIFVDDFVLDAVVVGYNPDSATITLEIAMGTLTIPKGRILTVEYDTTVARSLPDDNQGCLALAELMEEHEGFESAIDVLDALYARKNAPENLEMRLARLYEKLGKYPQAIERLREYLTGQPEDLFVQSEIDRLMSELKGRKGQDSEEAPVIDVVKSQVEEGLEGGGWRIEPWGNPGEIRYISMGKKADRLLKVEFFKKDKDKVAVRKNFPRKESDLTSNSICMFDAYNNTTKPLKVAVAVVTSPGWKYFESKQFSLPPRQWKQKVKIDMAGNDFKSEATGWKHSSTVENLKSTIQIILLVYEHEKEGIVFFNNIKFVQPPQS